MKTSNRQTPSRLADSPSIEEMNNLLTTRVISKNFNSKRKPVWVINIVAVDDSGHIASPERGGLTWVDHLIEDNWTVAKGSHKCSITTPFSTVHFDISAIFKGGV